MLEMDLEKSSLEKIKENKKEYPIAASKGKSVKYTEFNE